MLSAHSALLAFHDDSAALSGHDHGALLPADDVVTSECYLGGADDDGSDADALGCDASAFDATSRRLVSCMPRPASDHSIRVDTHGRASPSSTMPIHIGHAAHGHAPMDGGIGPRGFDRPSSCLSLASAAGGCYPSSHAPMFGPPHPPLDHSHPHLVSSFSSDAALPRMGGGQEIVVLGAPSTPSNIPAGTVNTPLVPESRGLLAPLTGGAGAAIGASRPLSSPLSAGGTGVGGVSVGGWAPAAPAPLGPLGLPRPASAAGGFHGGAPPPTGGPLPMGLPPLGPSLPPLRRDFRAAAALRPAGGVVDPAGAGAAPRQRSAAPRRDRRRGKKAGDGNAAVSAAAATAASGAATVAGPSGRPSGVVAHNAHAYAHSQVPFSRPLATTARGRAAAAARAAAQAARAGGDPNRALHGAHSHLGPLGVALPHGTHAHGPNRGAHALPRAQASPHHPHVLPAPRAGGPCDHCGAADSPQWRRGPPGKPTLCNACGTRWRRTDSLDRAPGPAAVAAAAAAAAASAAAARASAVA